MDQLVLRLVLELVLELILALVDSGADAAGSRADAIHESFLLAFSCALARSCPSLATLIVVRADSAAHTARGRAVLHHSHWIAFALTRIVPDVALGSIGIGANGLLTDATRGGARVVHPLRVLVAACFLALTLGGPTWALGPTRSICPCTSLCRRRM